MVLPTETPVHDGKPYGPPAISGLFDLLDQHAQDRPDARALVVGARHLTPRDPVQAEAWLRECWPLLAQLHEDFPTNPHHAGQLGDGTRIARSTPAPVSGLTGVIAIAAANGHTVALDGKGGTRHFVVSGGGLTIGGLTLKNGHLSNRGQEMII